MTIGKKWILTLVLAGSIAGGALDGGSDRLRERECRGRRHDDVEPNAERCAERQVRSQREREPRGERERCARSAGGRRAVPDSALAAEASGWARPAHPRPAHVVSAERSALQLVET